MSEIKGFMGMVRSKQLRDLDKREGLKLEKKTFQVIIGILGITVIGVSEIRKRPLGSKLAIKKTTIGITWTTGSPGSPGLDFAKKRSTGAVVEWDSL